jgi:hypothetical protein
MFRAIGDCLWTEFRHRRCLITAKWIVPGDDLRAAEVVLQLRQRCLDSASTVTHRLLQISKFYESIDDLSGGASTSEL